ncbi:MAG: hypothetical protein V4628_13340 [Pseudomonadota bacterium]
MAKINLVAYKNRLLDAGVPYALVQRNLRELQDHHHDLQQLALSKGFSNAEALAVASQQLGDYEQLAAAIIERPELRSKLHRFPIGTTVVLPLLAHFFACVLLALALLLPAITIESMGIVDLMRSHPQWVTNLLELLKILLMYIITPIVGCVFAFIGIRNHVPRRFWITGLVLLCLLGSSLNVHLEWPDPETAKQGTVGVSYSVGYLQSYGKALTYTLRLATNVLLCGCFVLYYRRKEQTAGIPGQSL